MQKRRQKIKKTQVGCLKLEVPQNLYTRVANTDFLPNGDGTLFFANPRVSKPFKQCDYKVQHSESRLIFGVIGNGSLTGTFEVTVRELENFVKKAKRSKLYFDKISKKRGKKKCSFFLHFNPELSFYIKG